MLIASLATANSGGQCTAENAHRAAQKVCSYNAVESQADVSRRAAQYHNQVDRRGRGSVDQG
jgi:hypothetical protein